MIFEDRCQSCGIPLEEEMRGSNNDFTANEEFCKFCFLHGEFTEPYITMEEMVSQSTDRLMSEFNFPMNKAREFAEHYVPQLSRWQ